MNRNDDERAYWVIVTKEGEEPKFVEQFDTRDEAIRAASSLAWDNEEDVLIVVDDDQGDEHWNNEGDWRNAVTH